jgi:hypothetical protein
MYPGMSAESKLFLSAVRKGESMVGTLDRSPVSLNTVRLYGFLASDDLTVVTITGIAFSTQEHRIIMSANNITQQSLQIRPLSSSRMVAYFEPSKVTRSSGLKSVSVFAGGAQYLGSPSWVSQGSEWPGRVSVARTVAPTTGFLFVDIQTEVNSFIGIGSLRIGSSPVTFFLIDDDPRVIRLRIPPNSGIQYLQFVSRVRSISLMFSYESSEVRSIQPGISRMSTGSMHLEMFGKSLGTASLTPKFRVRVSTCEANLWVSDSYVSCKSVRAQTEAVTLVTIGNLVSQNLNSSLTAFFSVSGIPESSPPKTASVQIAVSGYGASLNSKTPVAKIGHFLNGFFQVCTSCARHSWISDSIVICKSASGFGTSLSAVVSNVLGAGLYLHHYLQGLVPRLALAALLLWGVGLLWLARVQRSAFLQIPLCRNLPLAVMRTSGFRIVP